jgi:uncharacterized sporulation protein YeaH/YhbH (DUF444 family)
MQDKKKKTKKQIKVHDLKPSKDAKGGVATNVNVNRGVSHSVQRPGNPNS